MARRVYTDMDRARAAVMLQANDGNVKRTARELGLPVMTVSDWKQLWEREGYPENIAEVLPAAIEDLTGQMKSVVIEAVRIVREKLPQASAKDAAWIAGVFTDKLRLIEGQATHRTETVHTVQLDPIELAKQLEAYVADAVDAANVRHGAIEDAEWEQVGRPALPAGGRS